MNDAISTFLLMNGMEILARVRDVSNPEYIVVDHPVIPQITASGNLGFVPAVMTGGSDVELKINRSSIIAEAEPRQDIAEAYRQHLSPIVQPKKEIITG